MLFLTYFTLILSVNAQNNFKNTVDKLVNEQYTDLLLKGKPEVGKSCYFTSLQETGEIYITCPTQLNCYTNPFHREESAPINPLIGSCPDGKLLPVDKVGQLQAVYRMLTSFNETMCDDQFQSIESFQAFFIQGIDLGQLGHCSSMDNDNVSECQYKLNFLNIVGNEIESLSNDSFCQFRQLEILSLHLCGLKTIEERAIVHLVHLKALLMSSNELTHLHKNLFQNNVHLQYVDLRNNQLQLPALSAFSKLNVLKYLLLDYNQLQYLNNTLIFPSSLEELSMSDNGISTIGLELINLVNLTQLKMQNNDVTEVNKNAFQNLGSLRFISLNENKIEQFRWSVFKDNLQLERMDLSMNELKEFPPVGHLNNLEELKVQQNGISSINRSNLFNCSHLSYLDLSQNRLNFIEEGAFDNIKQLLSLDLSYNQLSLKNSNFQSSNKIFNLYLDFNNFTTFSFKNLPWSVSQLSITNNQIQSIEAFTFTMVQPWNLSSVNFSHNQLVSIEHLRLPPTVQTVDFSFNKIQKIMSFADIVEQNLRQLRSIDLRNNNINVLCEEQLVGIQFVTKINFYLSANPLKCTCDTKWIKYSRDVSSMQFTDLDDLNCQLTTYGPFGSAITQLKTLEDDQFLCPSNYLNSTRCECPRAEEAKWCKFSCPFNCTCLSDAHFDTIHFLCDHKQFLHMPDQFLYNQGLAHSEITFDLSGNFISHVVLFNIGQLDGQIIKLNLSNSNVESIEDAAFSRLTGLRNLDLSFNRLKELPPGLFRQQAWLAHLDLSHNLLEHLANDTFSALLNLQYLYLHNNSMQQLDLQQFKGLEFLTNITLHNNRWYCQCDFIKTFRTILVDPTTPIHNKLALNCTEVENGLDFNIANFNMDHCSTQIQHTVLIVFLTFGFLFLVISILVFKWRFELQVLIYSHYGLRMFHRMEEEVESKQYDAFVAYNSDDSDFLVNELMPGLEAIDRPYRLCIHHRDFPGGAYIQDSILDAIDMSSRTIIVLSDSFVSSGWCRFEFKSAHMKMLEDRCPRILVILVREVPETLDPEMKLYLRTNTYLKWGEKLFWQKLYYAMPDKRVTTPATDIMPMKEL